MQSKERQLHTLFISPSSITALLIFLNSSQRASISLTLTAPKTIHYQNEEESSLNHYNVKKKREEDESIQTVSLASSSGSPGPPEDLPISISKQRNKELQACLKPSTHCVMIPLVNQNSPCLLKNNNNNKKNFKKKNRKTWKKVKYICIRTR